uniref:Phosphoglycerate mutase n=1 Tax=Caulobacter sp. (strain K31) TaxID=366602 RepID=B0T5Z8_CAUSK
MIYLCRHGETAFNRERRLQGRGESELTALGQRQAEAMADLLHGLVLIEATLPWRIVASPLGRTRATAAAISARLGVPVEIDERLVEIDVGDWSGRLRDDVAREHPELFKTPEWFFAGPGGETYEDMMARLSDWLAAQAAESERRLIVVSHGVAGRFLRGAYLGLSRPDLLALDVPQDAIFRLADGQVDRLECEPVKGVVG